MKIIKSLNKQKTFKSFKYIIISIISLYILAAIYSFIFEQDKLTVDRYNFKQLEKVQLILKENQEKKIYYTLKGFNQEYNTNIKPIKNCYYLSYDNGNKPYIFGFKLESLIYRFIHFGKNYAYPSYYIPKGETCFGLNLNGSTGSCYDDRQVFIKTISNPCKD